MPEISRFFGIIITINYREHDPPHFHAWYGGADISVRISDGSVSREMQRKALVQAGKSLRKIEPLD